MKAILKKMDLIVNLKGFAAALLGVWVLVSSHGAWGQSPPGSPAPAAEAMEANISGGTQIAESSNNLANILGAGSLPRSAPAPKDKDSGGAEKGTQSYGNNLHKNVNIVLPPLKGFRQLADAAPIQDMYKDLINKKVPVLVQTMMMVENGAATGFIGSMNMVSNLMNNTIQTQEFQLQLMDLTDDTGQMKYAYAGAIKKALETGGGATTWPAALYLATGDQATEDTKGKIEDIRKKEQFQPSDAPNSGTPAPAPGAGGVTKESFVKTRLMPRDPQGGTGTTGYKNEKLDELTKEFIEIVGDFEIELKPTGDSQIAREIKIAYIKPTEEDGQWGVSLKAKKETEKVWKNLNELMHKLCEFKQKNRNNTLEPTAKITASLSAGWTPEMWKDASAPDIVITQNILEQIFLVSRQSKNLSELNCAEEYPSGSGLKVPFKGDFAAATTGNPDLCKKEGGKVTPCLRFQALYHMANIIGTSRALHTYDILKSISERFAKDPATQQLNQRLFIELLGEGEIGIFIDKNRDRWAEFTLYMARYMQGQQGSGGTFKPGGSNAVGISPGADRQGK